MMGKIDCWGIDIFRLDEITKHRPLTAVAYTILQVRGAGLSHFGSQLATVALIGCVNY